MNKLYVGGASRFAALEIEDVSDEQEDNRKEQKVSSAEKNAKRRARKKKKALEAHEQANELRNLAFSKPISAKAIQNVHEKLHVNKNGNDNSSANKDRTSLEDIYNGADPMSWEQWKNRDEEFVVDQFQKDLEAALHISAEEIGKSQKNQENNTKTKKKSKKQNTMSLEEFNSINEIKPVPSQCPSNDNFLIQENTKFTIKNGYCPEELDPYHYGLDVPQGDLVNTPLANTSETNNKKSHKKKKKKNPTNLTEALNELKKEDKEKVKNIEIPVDDNVTLLSMKSEMKEKDILIDSLQTELNSLKDELASVKKRNKQLCFILGQAEMKEKAEILLQVDELTSVKNELSDELSSTYTALEQERSKVSALKIELGKFQNVRTRVKSVSEEK